MTQFSKGDKVIHTGKPEWGPGDVLSAEGITHEGRAFQRLSIRFARAGLKTISTAFATLKPASESAAGAITATASASDDPLEQALRRKTAQEALQVLPEAATDPFLPLLRRVESTLGAYGALESGRAMLDWAAVQTGLADPLAVFSRHDLEQELERYRVNLDNHLRKLLPQARKADTRAVDALVQRAGGAAKAAVRRVDIGR